MARKTIEQLIKPYIEIAIQSLLTAEHTNAGKELHTIRLTNDIQHADATDTRLTIPAVMTTGEVARATAKDVLQFKVPVSFTFLVESNFMETFLEVMNSYCLTWHRYLDSVTDDMESDSTADDVTYNYYFDLRSAKPAGDPFSRDLKYVGNDPKIKRESVQMQLVHLTGDLYYGVGQFYHDTRVFVELTIAGTTAYHEIIAIQELASALEPAFNPTLLVEEELPQIDYTGDTHKKAVRVYRVPGDPLQDYILGLHYTSRTAASFNAKVKITVASVSVNVEYNAKLSNIQQNKLGDTEYLSFAMTLLDAVS